MYSLSSNAYYLLAQKRKNSDLSGISIHPAVWQQQTWGKKWGVLCSFWGEPGPHLTQCAVGRGLPPHQVAS